jgi:hypothetical protein
MATGVLVDESVLAKVMALDKLANDDVKDPVPEESSPYCVT